MKSSILAVVAGFALWSVLWLGGGAALRAVSPGAYDDAGMTGNTVQLALVLALSVVCSLASGFVAGRMTACCAQPVKVLAGLLLVVGLVVQISVWDQMPLWYHAGFLLLLVPMTLFGSQFGARPSAPA